MNARTQHCHLPKFQTETLPSELWTTWIERMTRWLVGLLLGGSTIVTSALANSAQAQSLDRRAYKGNLECEETPARTSLAIIVRDGMVTADAPTYDMDGLLISANIAAGRVDSAGVLHFGHTVFMRDAELRANYTVTLGAAGGTLTGTQVWTLCRTQTGTPARDRRGECHAHLQRHGL